MRLWDGAAVGVRTCRPDQRAGGFLKATQRVRLLCPWLVAYTHAFAKARPVYLRRNGPGQRLLDPACPLVCLTFCAEATAQHTRSMPPLPQEALGRDRARRERCLGP